MLFTYKFIGTLISHTPNWLHWLSDFSDLLLMCGGLSRPFGSNRPAKLPSRYSFVCNLLAHACVQPPLVVDILEMDSHLLTRDAESLFHGTLILTLGLIVWHTDCIDLLKGWLERNNINYSNEKCTAVYKQNFKPARTVHRPKRVVLGSMYNVFARSQRKTQKGDFDSDSTPLCESSEHICWRLYRVWTLNFYGTSNTYIIVCHRMSVDSVFGTVARRLRPVRRDVISHPRRGGVVQSDAGRAAGDAERPDRHAADRRPPRCGRQRRDVGPGSDRHHQLRGVHATALSASSCRRRSALQVDEGLLRLR